MLIEEGNLFETRCIQRNAIYFTSAESQVIDDWYASVTYLNERFPILLVEINSNVNALTQY